MWDDVQSGFQVVFGRWKVETVADIATALRAPTIAANTRPIARLPHYVTIRPTRHAHIPVAIFRERRHIAPTHALARHARLIRLARTRHIHAILANYPRALGRALRLAGPRTRLHDFAPEPSIVVTAINYCERTNHRKTYLLIHKNVSSFDVKRYTCYIDFHFAEVYQLAQKKSTNRLAQHASRSPIIRFLYDKIHNMVNFIQKHQNTSNIVRLCIFCSAIAASGNTPRRRAMCSFHCAHTHGFALRASLPKSSYLKCTKFRLQ